MNDKWEKSEKEFIDKLKKILIDSYFIGLDFYQKNDLITKVSIINKKCELVIDEKTLNEIKIKKIDSISIDDILSNTQQKEIQLGLEKSIGKEGYRKIKIDIQEKNIIDKETSKTLIVLSISDLVELDYIDNVQDLINKIKKYELYNTDDNKPNFIYFRGNQLNFDLSTSLYRNNDAQLPKLEHILNNRAIQSMPNDFDGCESFFDKLTILKHFNCPSRLLDITKSSLVASFFALDKYNEDETVEYGQIHLIFPKDFDKIKNSQNSDSVSLLSALSTTNKNLNFFGISEKIVALLEYLDEYFNQISYDINSDIANKLEEIILKIYKLIECKKNENWELVETIIKTLDKEYCKKINKTKYSKDKYNKLVIYLTLLLNKINVFDNFLGELQHQAELINSSFKFFTPSIEDIDTYYIVHPSLNNKRIVNQQGLFLLIGAKLDNKENQFIKGNTSYLNIFENDDRKRVVFIINNKKNKENKKGEFYKELDKYYNINKGFIYPELERKINQIKYEVLEEYSDINI